MKISSRFTVSEYIWKVTYRWKLNLIKYVHSKDRKVILSERKNVKRGIKFVFGKTSNHPIAFYETLNERFQLILSTETNCRVPKQVWWQSKGIISRVHRSNPIRVSKLEQFQSFRNILTLCVASDVISILPIDTVWWGSIIAIGKKKLTEETNRKYFNV